MRNYKSPSRSVIYVSRMDETADMAAQIKMFSANVAGFLALASCVLAMIAWGSSLFPIVH